MFVDQDIETKKLKKEKVEEKESWHIDFDRKYQIFYNNLYLVKNKFAIKMPLFCMKEQTLQDEIIIEKFDLTKYVYLINYK